jgi:hypothetical protein
VQYPLLMGCTSVDLSHSMPLDGLKATHKYRSRHACDWTNVKLVSPAETSQSLSFVRAWHNDLHGSSLSDSCLKGLSTRMLSPSDCLLEQRSLFGGTETLLTSTRINQPSRASLPHWSFPSRSLNEIFQRRREFCCGAVVRGCLLWQWQKCLLWIANSALA